MAAEAAVAIPNEPPDLETIVISPADRANLVIRLLGEITVIGIPENNHDLNIYFLTFAPDLIADLQRLVPPLANVTRDLLYGSIFLGLAASPDRTRAAAQQARVIDAINNRDPDFLRGLERYRVSEGPLVEDNDKLMALLNFFTYGRQIFQHCVLQTGALLRMTNEFLRIFPAINRITDYSNKLIMSTITKQEGYTFARACQEDIDSLGEACQRYYELAPPVFEARDFIDVRAAFVNTPMVKIPQDF